MTTYNENLSYIQHSIKERKWDRETITYEIPITFYHTDGRIFESIMSFNSSPSEQEISDKIDLTASGVDVAEEEIIAEDGEQI